MQADLEFEYPQKLEKIVVKNEILNWLNNEEEKLKNIAIEFAIEQEARNKSQTKLTPGDDFYLTYEDYYGNTDMVGSSSLSSLKFRQNEKTKMSYEAFMNSYASKNIFDNDLLEMQYKFWESEEDRELRLKKTWLEQQRRNIEGGVDALSTQE